ncbi:MAG: nitronate monooxygenase, partial [Pseudomonadota bacterium]|nr:nitronate monooxygenase [Pseudomonadota bacterium]
MTIASRVQTFCEAYGLRLPILLAPMAGACPVALSQAVARAGGMGACGALLMTPDAISDWARQMRAGGNGAFQMNLWLPDPPPARDPNAEAVQRDFLSQWGPEVPAEAAEAPLQDFSAQVDAIIAAGPSVISSIMGVYYAETVQRLKERRIRWFATVTTVAEALEAEAAGADAIVAQGSEAGGHRGAFHADRA